MNNIIKHKYKPGDVVVYKGHSISGLPNPERVMIVLSCYSKLDNPYLYNCLCGNKIWEYMPEENLSKV